MARTVITITARELVPGDVIHFGDGVCFVVGVEFIANTETGFTLITEGIGGMQYIDYISPHRAFTAVRTETV